jgi:hypothetical protein
VNADAVVKKDGDKAVVEKQAAPVPSAPVDGIF